MDIDRIFAELARESEEIITGMRDWRTANPHSTFAEIKAAVDDRLEGLRTRRATSLSKATRQSPSPAATGPVRPSAPGFSPLDEEFALLPVHLSPAL